MPSNGARTTVRVSLLARRHRARTGRGQVALGVVAAHFGVFHRGGRDHAGGQQGFLAFVHALGLGQRLLGGAGGFIGRGQAVADRGFVQAQQDIAFFNRLAVLLST
jgi:hypothetical protein